jgi:hypothetical protein
MVQVVIPGIMDGDCADRVAIRRNAMEVRREHVVQGDQIARMSIRRFSAIV